MSEIANERTTAPVPAIYKPIASPAEIVDAHDQFKRMVEGALTPGVDYGVLPSTSKPILLKPGAERLLLAAGLYAGDIEVIEQTVDPYVRIEWTKRRWDERSRSRIAIEGASTGYWRFVIRVAIFERATGNRVGEAVSSCSSMEDKYIENPRDTEHTGLAMAIKRAIVSATQRTLALSGLFAEDGEADNVLHPQHNSRKKGWGGNQEPIAKPQKSQMNQKLESHLTAMGYGPDGIARILNAAVEKFGKAETPAAILACANREEIEQVVAHTDDGR